MILRLPLVAGVVVPLVFGAFGACRTSGAARPQVQDRSSGGGATGIQAVPSVSPIRGVDWMNRTYDVGEASYTVAGGIVESDEGFFAVTEPVYGDLDGDGTEEAVVITLEGLGGTGRFSAVDVYTMKDGTEILLGGIPGGDRGDGGIHEVHVESGTLIVDRFASRDGDGACCPTQLQVERWTWNGERFVEDEGARTLTGLTVDE
jgi:hypothetical protein